MTTILEKRTNLDDKVKEVLFKLKYKNNPIQLVGSSSLRSQQYYSDFDCVSVIDKKDKPETIFKELESIINKIKQDPDLYFIELKIQTKDNKFRYYKNDKLNLKVIEDNYKNIEFFKIDLCIWFDYHFTDLSIIYFLFSQKATRKEREQGIKQEIKEFEEEGNYFKVLKRKFIFYKGRGNHKKLKQLTKIFNSELGQKYRLISNLETLENLYDHYKDNHTKERIKINLKYLGLNKYNPNNLEKEIDKLKKEINDQAKELNNKFIV